MLILFFNLKLKLESGSFQLSHCRMFRSDQSEMFLWPLITRTVSLVTFPAHASSVWRDVVSNSSSCQLARDTNRAKMETTRANHRHQGRTGPIRVKQETTRANQRQTGNNQGQSEPNRKQRGPIRAKQETNRANQSQTGATWANQSQKNVASDITTVTPVRPRSVGFDWKLLRGGFVIS